MSAALAVAGLTLFVYKSAVVGLPLRPRETTPVWTVEARVTFEPSRSPIKASLRIPQQAPGFAILDEHFVSYGYGLTTQTVGEQREAVWSKRRARGRQTLYYRAVIYRDRGESGPDEVPPFPEVPDYEEPYRSAAMSLLDEVRTHSADITTFASQLVQRLNDPSPDETVRLLLGDAVTDAESRVDTAIGLLAGARIPAQKIRGVFLAELQREVVLVPWLAVHNGQRWVFLDPESGAPGFPEDYFVWSRGADPLLDIEDSRAHAIDFAVVRNVYGSLEVAHRRAGASPSFDFSLFALPIRTQAVYQILMLIPLGALVVVLMRNVVGVSTFGTFMPILIALSFRETQLLWGIALFTLSVALGLAARFYMERLKLLHVPRLAAVLTVVILLLAMLSIVSHGLGLERGLSVALFPIVILTMTIERLSIVWEERGYHEALQEGVGSLLVAVLAYAVFTSRTVQHVTFVFPELLLVVLALLLLLGRYSGYRLLELRRFQALTNPSHG